MSTIMQCRKKRGEQRDAITKLLFKPQTYHTYFCRFTNPEYNNNNNNNLDLEMSLP